MRRCGDCTVCCWVARVPELLKPPQSRCSELTREGDGCGLHGRRNRPQLCQTFQCAWLREMLPEEDRPDLTGIMFTLNHTGRGLVVFAVEVQPHALTTARDAMIRMARRVNCPIIVSRFESKYPNDKGDEVVLRDELASRGHAIIGEELWRSDDVAAYHFTRRAA